MKRVIINIGQRIYCAWDSFWITESSLFIIGGVMLAVTVALTIIQSVSHGAT